MKKYQQEIYTGFSEVGPSIPQHLSDWTDMKQNNLLIYDNLELLKLQFSQNFGSVDRFNERSQSYLQWIKSLVLKTPTQQNIINGECVVGTGEPGHGVKDVPYRFRSGKYNVELGEKFYEFNHKRNEEFKKDGITSYNNGFEKFLTLHLGIGRWGRIGVDNKTFMNVGYGTSVAIGKANPRPTGGCTIFLGAEGRLSSDIISIGAEPVFVEKN